MADTIPSIVSTPQSTWAWPAWLFSSLVSFWGLQHCLHGRRRHTHQLVGLHIVSGPAGMDVSLTSVIPFICSDPVRKSHGLGPISRLSSLLGIVGPHGALLHDLSPGICCLWWVWTHFPYGLSKNKIGLPLYLSCISGYLSLLGGPVLCWSSRSDRSHSPIHRQMIRLSSSPPAFKHIHPPANSQQAPGALRDNRACT